MNRHSLVVTRSCMVLVFLFALSPSTAMADCDLLRKFNAVQSNGFNVVFDLSDVENGKATGSAHYFGDSDFHQVNGQADATFDGLSLTIDVHWDNGSIGHYEGRIDPASGHLTGATKDLTLNPSGFQAKVNWVRWESKQKFNCAQEAGASPSTIAARCSEYAKTAVQQKNENVALGCGFTGARWDSNANNEDWCRAVSPDLPVSETTVRANALNDCRAQIALRGQIDKKPNIPTGDITKPVTPAPYEPLPPAGTGSLFKQMKP